MDGVDPTETIKGSRIGVIRIGTALASISAPMMGRGSRRGGLSRKGVALSAWLSVFSGNAHADSSKKIQPPIDLFLLRR